VAYPKMYLYQNIFAQILKISILFKSLDCHVQRIKLNGDMSLGGTEVESLSTVGTWPKRLLYLTWLKRQLQYVPPFGIVAGWCVAEEGLFAECERRLLSSLAT